MIFAKLLVPEKSTHFPRLKTIRIREDKLNESYEREKWCLHEEFGGRDSETSKIVEQNIFSVLFKMWIVVNQSNQNLQFDLIGSQCNAELKQPFLLTKYLKLSSTRGSITIKFPKPEISRSEDNYDVCITSVNRCVF